MTTQQQTKDRNMSASQHMQFEYSFISLHEWYDQNAGTTGIKDQVRRHNSEFNRIDTKDENTILLIQVLLEITHFKTQTNNSKGDAAP